MKKIKAVAAIVAVFTMMATTMVFAAPSPTAGTITVVDPVTKAPSSAQIKQPEQKELEKLAAFISESLAQNGMTASVKTSVSIVAPKGYKGGEIPTVMALAGIPNGATNVFAYILLTNGKKIIVPCTVKNGYVGFVSPGYGTVTIVQLNPTAATSAIPR